MRRLLVRLHLWLGLTVGALLAALGLAGSVLVFQDEIDRALNPSLLAVAPPAAPAAPAAEGDVAGRLPLAALLRRVRAAYPDAPVLRVNLARSADQPHEVWLGPVPERLVYVDPWRGTILGDRGSRSYLLGRVFWFHTHLLSGERGELVVGAAGLVLLFLGLSGVYVWWPRFAGLRSALTVRRDLGRRRLHFDLHRVTGAVAAVLLVSSSVTGLSLVFHDQFMAGLNLATRSPARPAAPRVAPRTGATPIPADSALALAARAIPGAALTWITLPARADAPYVVRLRHAAESHPNGRNFVYVDPYDGRVLQAENALAAPVGTRAYNVLYPTHIGRVGGTAGRLVILLVGLVPLALYLTGATVWWSKRQRSGARAVRSPRSRYAPRGRSPRRGAHPDTPPTAS